MSEHLDSAPMGGFRAKDADRERYVEVIEAAYVDGQLGDQDRDLRVSRALTAETLDELDALTRDLQNQPPAVVVPPTPAPRVAAPALPPLPRALPARPVTPSESVPLKVIWVAVVAVFAAVVLGMISSAQDDMDPFGPGVDQTTITWDEIDDVDPAPEPGFRMRAADVRAVLSAFEGHFGTREAYEIDFFPRRVVVEVPVGARGQRFERWAWDGTWTRTAGPARVDGPPQLVDLGTLAAGPLVDNIATARGALRVEQGRFDRAVLSRSGDEPAVVTIIVTNRFNESGSLTTTPAGEILGRQPFVR